MKSARQADSVESLDRLEAEADEILATTVVDAEKNDLDQSAMAAFSLALDQLRAAIAARRAALLPPVRPAKPRAVAPPDVASVAFPPIFRAPRAQRARFGFL